MYEKTRSSKMIYRGRLLGLEVQEVEFENGRTALREIVRHGGAVAVLAQRPDGRFLFVRQFRKPVEQPLLEVVAGNRDPNETPEACARRELTEETGHVAEKLEHMGFIYPSPGYVDERIDVFWARTAPQVESPRPDDDERLELVALDREDIQSLIRDKEIHDAKTLAAWAMYTVWSANQR